MCTQKEKRAINHFTRTLIAIAGTAGMMVDGFQGGDPLCVVSMLVWLWQSECNGLEEKLLDQFKRFKAARQPSH